MTMTHRPRIAVITGGTTGIGLACARRLLRSGHRVAAFSHQSARVAEAAELLSTEGGDDNVYAASVDLRDPAEIEAFFLSVAERWAPPSVLVCNPVSRRSATMTASRSRISRPRNGTTCTIAPGRILTEMTGVPDAPANRPALQRIPAGRLGRPEDIAAIVDFLASDQAGFINGAIIDVNGGEFVPA